MNGTAVAPERRSACRVRYITTLNPKLTTHDSAYFRQRAAEARAAASAKGRDAEAAVAGELALAYAALARRRAAEDEAAADSPPPIIVELV